MYVLTRFGFFCLLVFLLLSGFINIPDLVYQAKILALNRLRPESNEYLQALSKGQVALDVTRLEEFRQYYKEVFNLFPERADAMGLYGYCSYLLGEHSAARDAYSQALALQPDFFWYHYNLGVDRYHRGDYPLAIAHLRKAYNRSPEQTLDYVFTSERLYIRLYREFHRESDMYFVNQLQQAYDSAYKMVILSYYQLKQYQSVMDVANDALQKNNPSKGFYFLFLGKASFNMKEYEDAIMYLRNSLQFDIDNPDVYEHWGQCLEALGHVGQGRLIRQKSRELSQESNVQPDTRTLFRYELY